MFPSFLGCIGGNALSCVPVEAAILIVLIVAVAVVLIGIGKKGI